MKKYPQELPAVLTYGGGTNSSAILVELIKRGYEPPTAIVFSDTGAEQPHTYQHIKVMSEYAKKNGFPEITIVRNEQPSKAGSIYNYCEKNRMLPAVAYGHKNCSVQFKIEPVQKFVNNTIGKKTSHIRIVGYDFDEINRSLNSKGKERGGAIDWFPLIEWEMGRDECVQSLLDAGLPPAGKSSCFMCPNMRPHEIKKLAQEYPDLAEKAIELEKLAAERREEDGKSGAIIGLGRTWRWVDLLATDDMFGFQDLNRDMPCGCYDGD